MKKFGALVVLLGVVSMAQAAYMPALSVQPSYLPITLTQSNTEITAVAPESVPYGCAVGNSAFGNDNVITADIKWDAATKAELGLCQRADIDNLNLYSLSFNPNNNYFGIVRITGGGSFINVAMEKIQGFVMDYDKTYTMTFSAIGSQLDGYLYDGATQLMHVSAVDTNFASGQIGLYMFKPNGCTNINGQWQNASYVPEPMTMVLLALGGLFFRRK